MKPVTDNALIQQLEADIADLPLNAPVTDPALIAELEGDIQPGTRRSKLRQEMSHIPRRPDFGPLDDTFTDVETGAPASVRSALSIKLNEVGKQGYLESVYGKGNVTKRSDGEFFYRDSPSSKWTKVDENTVGMRDFADWMGGLVEAAPPIIAGMTTANPLAVGAAATGGNVLRQGMSAALPGADEIGALERLFRAGSAGIMGGGSQAGSNVLFKALDKIRPHNLVASQVNRAYQTPTARAAGELEDVVGGFSPGQATGSRPLLMAEGVARQMPASADDVFRFDQMQVGKAVEHLSKTMDGITKDASGAITTGGKVTTAFNDSVNKALKHRSNQARLDFKAVDELTGKSPIISTQNTKATIQELIDTFDVPGGGDATATLVNRLKKLSSGDSGLPSTLNGEQAQRLLQIYGSAAKGTGQIFKDIDKGQQRLISSRVFSALQRDLDDAVEAGGQGGVAVEALLSARNNYKSNSVLIDDLGDSVLGRLFNGKYDPAPEAVADKFLKMHPTEVKAAASIINKSDPGTLQNVKRYMLEQAMESAKPSASATQIGAVPFSGNKFNTFVSKNADRLKSIMTKPEYDEVNNVTMALDRITDRAGMQGSQTAPFMMMFDAMRGAFTLNPIALGRSAATILAPRQIASAMMTNEGRKALMTLTTTSKPTKAAVAAAAYLTARSKSDEAISDYFGNGQDEGLPAQ